MVFVLGFWSAILGYRCLFMFIFGILNGFFMFFCCSVRWLNVYRVLVLLGSIFIDGGFVWWWC